jgi:hypothetical protein
VIVIDAGGEFEMGTGGLGTCARPMPSLPSLSSLPGAPYPSMPMPCCDHAPCPRVSASAVVAQQGVSSIQETIQGKGRGGWALEGSPSQPILAGCLVGLFVIFIFIFAFFL